MTRVFLDANILFSASNTDSVMGRLVHEAGRRVELLISTAVETEARRNLEAKRPAWLPGLAELLPRCTPVGDAFFPLMLPSAAATIKDSDRLVLCTAIAARSRYLLTGDKRDFGPLFDQIIKGVTVVSPARFAAILKDIPPREAST